MERPFTSTKTVDGCSGANRTRLLVRLCLVRELLCCACERITEQNIVSRNYRNQYHANYDNSMWWNVDAFIGIIFRPC
jgi:hypothetical protein